MRPPTAMSRLGLALRQSGGRFCITPGQDVLDGLGLLPYSRKLLGTVLDSVAEKYSLGDGSIN